MATPADYALTIEVNDVDVTAYVPYDSLYFEDFARGVSMLEFRIENPSGVLTPARAHTVRVIAKNLVTGPSIFFGYIMEITEEKRGDGVVIDYAVQCADLKVRLQKSVVPYLQLSGTDASILSNLLSNAYPDLSSLFDFATDVTSFASDLALTTNDISLLDALNELSAQANGADYRFEYPSAVTETTVTHDVGGFGDYTANGNNFSDITETTGGNSGNCVKGTDMTSGTGLVGVTIDMGSDVEISDITVDLFTDELGLTFVSNSWTIDIDDALMASVFGGTIDTAVTHDGTWNSYRASTGNQGSWAGPYTGRYISIYNQLKCSTGGTVDVRMDNATVEQGSGSTDTQTLVWDDTPTAADFSIDIQSGDEFAFDIELAEGDLDDFNSITVVGGYEEIAIDWTYESDGYLDHFALETAIRSITVYKNTGTDASPTWTVQSDGVWGTDTLTGEGGTKDVLYDPDNHWLYFDTNPSALGRAIRVTGNIIRPIRVRVEDINGSDPTFATTFHDDRITSIDQAVAIGQSALDKQNSVKRLSFTTYEPGLKPGQSIQVADSARGLDETLTINRITTKWLGASGHAQFKVYCGPEEETTADVLIANNYKRTKQSGSPAAVSTQTVTYLIDTDGERLIDTDGSLLYEVT